MTHLVVDALPARPSSRRKDARSLVGIRFHGVAAGVFPVLEVENGREWRINIEPTFEGLEDYLGLQGRFRGVDASTTDRIRQDIQRTWKDLRARCAMAEA